MGQHGPLYEKSPALQLVGPWLTARLPRLDPIVQRHFIQLTAGVFEAHSALVEQIAATTAFQAPEDSSNYTQVQRILHDQRLTVERLYWPLITQVLAEMGLTMAYLTIDESSHSADFGLFQVSLATDGMALPLGWVLYQPDDAWADEARELLQTIATLLPTGCRVTVLADRLHTGEPFLECLTGLGWDYIVRAKDDLLIETPQGWKPFYARTLPRKQGRFFSQVRIWKTRGWRTNLSIYKHVRDGFRPVTWFVISSLPAAKERFVEYACRWWQECGFRDLKSDIFDWERGKVRIFERVDVLLMAISAATWMLWMVGRQHEYIPRKHRATQTAFLRRKALIKQGIATFKRMVKHGRSLVIGRVPTPRVLDYPTTFAMG
jgi:hypothetical protein